MSISGLCPRQITNDNVINISAPLGLCLNMVKILSTGLVCKVCLLVGAGEEQESR